MFVSPFDHRYRISLQAIGVVGCGTRRSAQRDLSRSRIGRPPAVPKELIPHGKNVAGRPAAPTIFGRFAGAVATHFRGRIAAYEIWNEPNAAA
jgi:hypothetical protein